MKINISDILSGEFGHIREYVHNNILGWTLIESGKFQFVINKQNEIIFNNLNNHFKIVSNSFKNLECIIIHYNKIFCLETSEIEKIEYHLQFKESDRFIQFIGNDLSNAFINSFENGNKLIVFDKEILIVYNTVLNKSEFVLKCGDDVSSLINIRTKLLFDFLPDFYDLKFYGINPDKLVVSSDEQYFYIISAAEGKDLMVFNLADYSLCYNEIGSYAIEFGIFYNNYLVLPSGYDDYDKTYFRTINLQNGLKKINDKCWWDVRNGFANNDYLVLTGRVHDEKSLNADSFVKAIDLNRLIKYNTLVELNVDVQLKGIDFFDTAYITSDNLYFTTPTLSSIPYKIDINIDFSSLNKETKINLALSYENSDIIEKFCSEYTIESDLAKEYFIEVKKFLFLCSSTSDTLAPSAEIDKIWHTFILFTKDYRQYCLNFLGKFIDHVPEVKKDDSVPKENYLQNTITAYENEFGELNNDVWKIPYYSGIEEDCSNCSNCSSCNNCQSCSSCGGRGSQPSCVFTGSCFNCTNSGYSCVGENPNDL